MLQTFATLAQSRKFWVGTLTIAAVVAGTVALAKGMITTAGFVPFVSSVTAVGLASIGSIAWEDSAKKSALRTLGSYVTHKEGAK